MVLELNVSAPFCPSKPYRKSCGPHGTSCKALKLADGCIVDSRSAEIVASMDSALEYVSLKPKPQAGPISLSLPGVRQGVSGYLTPPEIYEVSYKSAVLLWELSRILT